MKRLVLAFSLLLAAFAHADSLEQNVLAIEKAAVDIKNAIQAKGGEMSGGLTNAADAIIAIPDKSNFDQTYIAWSNATVTIVTTTTNEIYYLVEWLQQSKVANMWIDLGVKANQDTYVLIGVSNMTDTTWSNTFGDTGDWGNLKFCLTIYQDITSIGYNGSWYEPNVSTIPSKSRTMVFTIDGNLFYIDGNLVQTMTKTTFTTKYNLYALNRNCDEVSNASRTFAGKLLWIDLKRAVDTTGTAVVPDMALIPAVDLNMRPCLLDILADPVKPYYLNQGTLEYSSPTGTIYNITRTVDSYNIPFPYETTITNTPLNHLTIDDATRYLYQTMSEGL